MGWVTIRIALAYLLPGFIPTLLFFSIVKINVIGNTGSITTVYILSSIMLGIMIDLVRHRIENIFVNWLNLTWIKYVFVRMICKIRKRPVGYLPLKRIFRNYDEKEKQSIKLWLSLQLEKHEDLNKKIEGNVILEKEYKNPTITSGDRWALLNILAKDNLKWMVEEYFSYYEFSFNCMMALILTEMINISFFISSQLTKAHFWVITVAFFILFIPFHELCIYWLLATKRFARKLILFSLIK